MLRAAVSPLVYGDGTHGRAHHLRCQGSGRLKHASLRGRTTCAGARCRDVDFTLGRKLRRGLIDDPERVNEFKTRAFEFYVATATPALAGPIGTSPHCARDRMAGLCDELCPPESEATPRCWSGVASWFGRWLIAASATIVGLRGTQMAACTNRRRRLTSRCT